MSAAVDLAGVAVRPEPDDNVAIVTRDLPAGTRIQADGTEFVLTCRVMEGHRIVVAPVADGEALLSWSTPFARAQGDLDPGTYVCTPSSLALLRERGIAGLPEGHTAVNEPLDPYQLDESLLNLGPQVDPVAEPTTFLGYARANGGAGTRNYLVIVGVTTRSGAFVTELARRVSAEVYPDFDGVVPVAHTEAGEDRRPNNARFVLSALAGFVVHPNVGAVLVVDEPGGSLTGQDVRRFMHAEGYPDISVPHAFFTRTASFGLDLAEAARIVEQWIPMVAAQERTEQPLSRLKIALQCGGSDAFSGITANPLAGAVAAEVIRHGGSAVLAETDELIGAEGYVLKNVRSPEVARKFLRTVDSFKHRVSWHGHTAEGNPSGGNVYRGLYNIVLKSVGAARKLDRHVRLDHVVDYAEPLPGPGFTFMDSPGNDLESVTGQVASGCNLIFFTTGNGSITNFPFVPTLKFVTTTPRYELLRHEMDVDAGRYLSGTSMEQLTQETFSLTMETASGSPSAGERAGHSQVSIWRDWKQVGPRKGIAISIDGRSARPLHELPFDERDAELDGLPLQTPVRRALPVDAVTALAMYEIDGRRAPEQLALLLPTSLCSGQIALHLADEAQRAGWPDGKVTRTVALPHTEGCGVTGGAAETTYARMMTSYLVHPNVRMALLLEHGCEKTHNDYFRARMIEAGLDPARFGWASIQRDGGIGGVSRRVQQWFESTAAAIGAPKRTPSALEDLVVGLEAHGDLSPDTANAFAEIGGWIVGAGGSVIVASSGKLLADETFRLHAFGSEDPVRSTLAHGQRPTASGWHVMRAPTTDWLETSSGLGASGVQVLLTHVAGGTVSGQRLFPVVQVSADSRTVNDYGEDLDAALTGGAADQARVGLDILVAVLSGRHVVRVFENGNVGFQVTRGLLGTST